MIKFIVEMETPTPNLHKALLGHFGEVPSTKNILKSWQSSLFCLL